LLRAFLQDFSLPFTGIVPPLSIQISTVGLTLTLGICVGDGEGSVEGISVGKTVGEKVGLLE
jgi:hypothetical protein